MNNRTLSVILFLLTLTVILISIGFYFQTVIDGVNEFISPEVLIAVVNAGLFITILIVFILTRRLLLSAKQERLLEIQEHYINYLRELVSAIRTQRHDFANHIQTVYALLKTDECQRAGRYVEELYQDVKITSELLYVNIPELSALLLVKTGIAAAKDISFIIEVESNLIKMNIKPKDINTIAGNLIDNAFDAVAVLNTGEKEVQFKIFDTPEKWVIQVANSGHISKEIRDKIFTSGFSTKEGENRGFGLASVKSCVKRNNGRIILRSQPGWGTRFTVVFPKNKLEGVTAGVKHT